jgi:uncharacterized protein YjbI with pentapeptide repeats
MLVTTYFDYILTRKSTQPNLRGANFTEANFEEANLEGADFLGATLKDANFKGVVGLPLNFSP